MDSNFRTFSFVDQIDSISSGSIRGRYRIPAGVSGFPVALAGEAVGQLAAWHAMCQTHFEFRPMAGIVTKVQLVGDPQPGDVLDLQAEISDLSPQAMSYSGRALVNGDIVIVLEGCVGPMLPAEQFDSRESLHARYDKLIEGAAVTGGFEGVPEPDMEFLTGSEMRQEAQLKVPQTAAYFNDHFPRMPVLPGTLQLHAQQLLVRELLRRRHPEPWAPREIANSKLRAFVPPGASLHMEASLHVHGSEPVVDVRVRHEARTVGSAQWRPLRELP